MDDSHLIERPTADLTQSDLTLSEDAEWFEYSKAANPIRPSLTPRIPYHVFPASLHAGAQTGVTPLDLSEALRCAGPATSPGLLASFVRIAAGDTLDLAPRATSQLLYVIRGGGRTRIAGTPDIAWAEGDVLALPGGTPARHMAERDAAFYAVDDSPLLAYLGVQVEQPRFTPTLYPAARNASELAAIAAQPGAAERSRISVLLGNRHFAGTRTITQTLWAMYGLLPVGSSQKPHRHQSVALDYIIDCAPGCYSLVGYDLDADGTIRDAHRVEWEAGIAFVTPPGAWHSHHNESGLEAHLLPIQDAGLQTYLRSLDIRFS